MSEEEITEYDVVQNGVSMNPKAAEAWDAAVVQLLDEADQGLFAQRLQLDTRTGRILYTITQGSEEDKHKPRASLLDVPILIVTSPAKLSIKVRATRVRVAGYVSQWAMREVVLDLSLRAALDNSVQELRMVRAMFNTAMSVHATWLEWTDESFKNSGVQQSASTILSYAIVTLYYLFQRDLIMDSQVMIRFLQEGHALRDMSDSLLLLLILSSPPESMLGTIESVNWIFKSAEERSLLQNAVGACLDVWLRVDRHRNAAERIIQSEYLHSILRLLLSYVDRETSLSCFAPELPFPTPNKLKDFEYPWAASILRQLSAVLDTSKAFARTTDTEPASLEQSYRGGIASIDAEWATVQTQIKDSYAGRQLEMLTSKIRSGPAGPDVTKTAQVDKRQLTENVAANGKKSQTTEKKQLGESAQSPPVSTLKKKQRVIASDEEEESPCQGSKKKKKSEAETTQTVPLASALTSRMPSKVMEVEKATTPSLLTAEISGSRPAKVRHNATSDDGDTLSVNEWRHIGASKSLASLLWTDGVPWASPYSSARSPSQLRRVKAFSEGGGPAPTAVVNMLRGLRNLPVDPKHANEPLFRTPHPALITFAAVSSAHASLLAQTNRLKSEPALNCAEIIRSAAFTLVTASRVDTLRSKVTLQNEETTRTQEEGDGSLAANGIAKPVAVRPMAAGIRATASEDSKVLLRFIARANLPQTLANAHVAIAKAIGTRVWQNEG